MSINSRLAALEKRHAPQPEKRILIVIYDQDGRAIPGSSASIVGMTREEVSALDNENTVLLNIEYASRIKPPPDMVRIFIPDNGRGDLQPNQKESML